MMKIIHIVQSLDIGGAEHLVVQMAAEQFARGMEAQIICLGGEGGLADKARGAGVPVSSMMHSGGASPLLVFRLARRIREAQADIVHTHNMGPLIYGSLAARLAGTRSINTRHGRAPKKAMPFIWNLNEFVVAVSEDAKQRMLEFNSIKREKVRVIRNGIEVQGSSMESLTEGTKYTKNKLTAADNFVVGTVGRLSPEKNQALLLRAFADFTKQAADVRLVIVGDGAERTNLEKLAEDLGIRDHVEFMGYRDDVPELMSQMDVFVLPSLEEGLSLTLLEAMAAGKPIIATDVGGNGEAVLDGKTGLLVPSEDAEAMSAAMLTMHNDNKLRNDMGAAGRRRVEECFSLKVMVDEYMNLYNSALEKGRGDVSHKDHRGTQRGKEKEDLSSIWPLTK